MKKVSLGEVLRKGYFDLIKKASLSFEAIDDIKKSVEVLSEFNKKGILSMWEKANTFNNNSISFSQESFFDYDLFQKNIKTQASLKKIIPVMEKTIVSYLLLEVIARCLNSTSLSNEQKQMVVLAFGDCAKFIINEEKLHTIDFCSGEFIYEIGLNYKDETMLHIEETAIEKEAYVNLSFVNMLFRVSLALDIIGEKNNFVIKEGLDGFDIEIVFNKDGTKYANIALENLACYYVSFLVNRNDNKYLRYYLSI